MKIETHCPICKKTSVIEVPDKGYAEWQAGSLLQHAMPGVPAATREQLLTGIDGYCWTKLMSEEES